MIKILTLFLSGLLAFQPLQADLSSLGEYDLDDETVIDVSEIAEATMSTTQSITELAIRFGINLLVCWILVQFFYYRKSRRRDYYFTFIIGVGLTLGLFAIFGVIRYRTETVPIREMTYLFVIIALAAMNGLAPVYRLAGSVTDNPHYVLPAGNIAVLVLSNLLVVCLIWILEDERLLKHTSAKLILYDRIELIVPERRAELVADLEKRVGVQIDNLEIGHVDFLRDAAYIKVYYTLEKGENATIDQLTKANEFIEQ